MRLIAHLFAISSLLGAGAATVIGGAAFGNAETIFQELIGACFLIVAGTLITATGIWVRVDQHEQLMDRAYDVIDRLDRLGASYPNRSTSPRQ